MSSPKKLHQTIFIALYASLLLASAHVSFNHRPTANAQETPGRYAITPSVVTTQQNADGSYQYLVNGIPETFISVGYNPIYRALTDEQRGANYRRDFQLLRDASANHILGWDADKGFEQDKFDEITLDVADEFGIGVVMPFYLPASGNYLDEAFLTSLLDTAATKIARFKDFLALRMWSLGNEVINDMRDEQQRDAFLSFYPRIADLFNNLDPNHPVIYNEAEDVYVPRIMAAWRADGIARPWLLYGAHFYTLRLNQALDDWPSYETGLPLFVTEFGSVTYGGASRADNYVTMWRDIRAHSAYVLGGSPYAWTTRGPEPTDVIWGLMDGNSRPVDDTFQRLAAEWRDVGS